MKKILLKKILLSLSILGTSTLLKTHALYDVSNNINFKFNQNLTAQITGLNYVNDNNEQIVIKIPSKVSKNGITYSVTSFSSDFNINCENIKEIYLPESFSGSKESILNIIKFNNVCPTLDRIYVDPRCGDLSSDSQGILYNKDKTHLITCPIGKKETIEIPKSVKSIYSHAFDKCKKIPKSIKIPLNIQLVGNVLRPENYDFTTNNVDDENEKNQVHQKIVIVLLGESGAGKTTIAEYLKKYGYINIPTYTTRPSRFEGEEGHIFVDIDSVNNIIPLDDNTDRKLIYITYFANNWYWAYEDQISDNDRSVIAFNPTDTKNFKEYVKDRKVVVVYLKTNRTKCVDRMKKRALNGSLTNDELTNDIERRVILDDNEYSSFSCDYVIDATKDINQTITNLENCLQQEGLK